MASLKDPFKKLKMGLRNGLTDDDVKTLKQLFRDDWGSKKLEEISSALDLFAEMEDQALIGADDVHELKLLFADDYMKKPNLVKLIEEYEDIRGKSTSNSFPDLTDEMTYLSENLGKDWLQLMHRLGVTDADIDEAEEMHPRNLREKIRCALKIWQRKKKEDATKENLLKALRACQLNLHAKKLENNQYK